MHSTRSIDASIGRVRECAGVLKLRTCISDLPMPGILSLLVPKEGLGVPRYLRAFGCGSDVMRGHSRLMLADAALLRLS